MCKSVFLRSLLRPSNLMSNSVSDCSFKSRVSVNCPIRIMTDMNIEERLLLNVLLTNRDWMNWNNFRTGISPQGISCCLDCDSGLNCSWCFVFSHINLSLRINHHLNYRCSITQVLPQSQVFCSFFSNYFFDKRDWHLIYQSITIHAHQIIMIGMINTGNSTQFTGLLSRIHTSLLNPFQRWSHA